MEGRGLSADRNAHAHNPDARSTSASSRSPPLAHYSRTRRTPPLSRPGPPEGPARTRRNRTGRWHWPAPARTSVRPPHDGASCLGTGGTNPGFAPTSSSPDTASRPAPSAPPSVARAGPEAKRSGGQGLSPSASAATSSHRHTRHRPQTARLSKPQNLTSNDNVSLYQAGKGGTIL